jgi:hypothetical protein
MERRDVGSPPTLSESSCAVAQELIGARQDRDVRPTGRGAEVSTVRDAASSLGAWVAVVVVVAAAVGLAVWAIARLFPPSRPGPPAERPRDVGSP